MVFVALVLRPVPAGTAAVIAPFIARDGALFTAFTQFGLALVGIVGATLAVAQLSNERLISGSTGEEVSAGCLACSGCSTSRSPSWRC